VPLLSTVAASSAASTAASTGSTFSTTFAELKTVLSVDIPIITLLDGTHNVRLTLS